MSLEFIDTSRPYWMHDASEHATVICPWMTSWLFFQQKACHDKLTKVFWPSDLCLPGDDLFDVGLGLSSASRAQVSERVLHLPEHHGKTAAISSHSQPNRHRHQISSNKSHMNSIYSWFMIDKIQGFQACEEPLLLVQTTSTLWATFRQHPGWVT